MAILKSYIANIRLILRTCKFSGLFAVTIGVALGISRSSPYFVPDNLYYCNNATRITQIQPFTNCCSRKAAPPKISSAARISGSEKSLVSRAAKAAQFHRVQQNNGLGFTVGTPDAQLGISGAIKLRQILQLPRTAAGT